MKNTWQRLARPTHPGEFLREDFLPDYGLSVADLAKAIKVSRQTVNELINEQRALSAAMALRLSRYFGNSPEFWLNAQREVDTADRTASSLSIPRTPAYRPRIGINTTSAGSSSVVIDGRAKKSLPAAARPT
ncbi:MAG: HigA family addiction module antidote protein [Deltaproteobacteria bacterium]|nr:HigA family addiction module antidote protein [Deltaproteobacteria bacterium]